MCNCSKMLQFPCIYNRDSGNSPCSAPCPSNKIKLLLTTPFFLPSHCFSRRKDNGRRRWYEQYELRFLLSLELRSHLLCSLLTLALLFPPPTQQITYQYFNRKAKRSGNVFVTEVFCGFIFFLACLF